MVDHDIFSYGDYLCKKCDDGPWLISILRQSFSECVGEECDVGQWLTMV